MAFFAFPTSSLLAFALALLLYPLPFLPAQGHGGHEGPAPECRRSDEDSSPLLHVPFAPGLITVDGDSSDWNSLNDFYSFHLRSAMNPDKGLYPHGPLKIKVVHDGRDVFFLLEFPGPYKYVYGEKKSCPSIALMFGVGDDATYYNMGGCQEPPGVCSSSSCSGHEVDIMHFSLGTAVPGRQYGANLLDNLNGTGKDSFGSLNDLYGWNAHCRYLDGVFENGTKIPSSRAQNDWRGAWSHSSIDLGYGLVASNNPYSNLESHGTYVFEFARSLRTSDDLQQDVQFTIGKSHRLIAAVWFPINNVPWTGSEHYSASCDWLLLNILPSGELGKESEHYRQASNTTGVISLILSIIAIFLSVAIGWFLRMNKGLRFQPLDGL